MNDVSKQALTSPDWKSLEGFTKSYVIVKVKEFISSEVLGGRVVPPGGDRPDDEGQEDAA